MTRLEFCLPRSPVFLYNVGDIASVGPTLLPATVTIVNDTADRIRVGGIRAAWQVAIQRPLSGKSIQEDGDGEFQKLWRLSRCGCLMRFGWILGSQRRSRECALGLPLDLIRGVLITLAVSTSKTDTLSPFADTHSPSRFHPHSRLLPRPTLSESVILSPSSPSNLHPSTLRALLSILQIHPGLLSRENKLSLAAWSKSPITGPPR